MDIKEKVGQRLMIGISGEHLDRDTEKHLKEIQPGAVILFKRNISSAAQVAQLISRIKQIVPLPPLIAIDQEGGRVIRFTKDITVFPGNMALGAAGSLDLAYQQGLMSALQLKGIGIDINLAPVVDVITAHHNPGITIRSFGDNPQKVADLASALITGTQQAGVAAVVKHFPGKGAAELDAHFDLPTVALPEEAFEEIHRYPFRKAIETGVQGIMSTHVHYPTLDSTGDHPATFSPTIVKEYIRTRCAFDGLIFSDDLEMGAIAKHYPIDQTCLQATRAGHDMLLICSDYHLQKKGFDTLVEAYTTSTLPREELEASITRMNTLRQFCQASPPPGDTTRASHPETLAEHIAQQAITIISDEKNLLPVNSHTVDTILLLIPDLSGAPALEEGYEPTEKHLIIKECRGHFQGTCTFHFFSLNPKTDELGEVTQQHNRNSTCILFISNAQEHDGQKELIKRVRQCYDNPVFVMLDNPFDYELLNAGDTCLTSYGFRRNQMVSLVKVIFGKAEATGNLPFRKEAWLQ
jgi:beta-N-acetylhexosaminidase